ncbi:MAG: tetratricopeptide repeat protein [Candidatus Rokubacteria bacterium]|nr:tetratricopeptide repeat protein [Candidatus Rokubacteria bacterium]
MLKAIPFLIALVTVLAFSPAFWNDFVSWDDEQNLLDNPHYRGLGWGQLRWMLTTNLLGHWIPLTWLSFGLDYLLWGMNPVGYHLTNLLLHAANGAVFYFVALRLLRLAMPGPGELALRLGAGAAAAFFALHPLRAESVAWVTERRDVLAGFFFLLTLLTYLKASEPQGARRQRLLAASLGSYALALLAKSIVMTLPFVLIVLDFYPLRRLGTEPREWITPPARKVWVEKLPYLLLGLAGAGIALYAVNPGLTSLEKYPLSARMAMALYSVWFYVRRTFVPLGLSPMYELPVEVNPLEPRFVESAIAVLILSAGLWALRSRWPGALAIWVSYGVILAPVSGLVHNGHQLVADRYSYLSGLGWALLVGAGTCAVIGARASGTVAPWIARLAAGAAAVSALSLGGLTWQQVQVWRDGQTLWVHAAELDPTCRICQNNVGTILLTLERPDLAIERFRRALTLNPGYLKAHGNLGVALLRAGRPAEAVEHLRRVLADRPDEAYIRTHLALALLQTGRPAEAVEHFRRVLARNPADADTLNHLGIALIQLGELKDGIEHLRQAIRLDPSHVEALTNLGLALTAVGNPAEAVEHLRRAGLGR